jgi:hypothetical protein
MPSPALPAPPLISQDTLNIDQNETAGLELYAPYDGLVAVPAEHERFPQVVSSDLPEHYKLGDNTTVSYEKKKTSIFPHLSRKALLIAVAIIVLLVVGAVLGGVLGSRSRRNDQQTTDPENKIGIST